MTHMEQAIYTPQLGCLCTGGVQTPRKRETEVRYIGNTGSLSGQFYSTDQLL